jgi:hypothetical protein
VQSIQTRQQRRNQYSSNHQKLILHKHSNSVTAKSVGGASYRKERNPQFSCEIISQYYQSHIKDNSEINPDAKVQKKFK